MPSDGQILAALSPRAPARNGAGTGVLLVLGAVGAIAVTAATTTSLDMGSRAARIYGAHPRSCRCHGCHVGRQLGRTPDDVGVSSLVQSALADARRR